MSYPNYATQYLDSNGFVKNFGNLAHIEELVLTLDAQMETLSEEHKEMKKILLNLNLVALIQKLLMICNNK